MRKEKKEEKERDIISKSSQAHPFPANCAMFSQLGRISAAVAAFYFRPDTT